MPLEAVSNQLLDLTKKLCELLAVEGYAFESKGVLASRKELGDPGVYELRVLTQHSPLLVPTRFQCRLLRSRELQKKAGSYVS